MCLNKTRLYNLGYSRSDYSTSPFIDVDCGHCSSCYLKATSGLAFRMQQEAFVKDTLPFWLTLTYSPLYRPYVCIYDDDRDHVHKISTWNRQHVSKFLKRIRRQLQYYYGVDKEAFQYLYNCERGSDREYIDWKGHYRIAEEVPHYHLCLLVRNVSSLVNIRKLPEDFFSWSKHHNQGIKFRNFVHYLIQKHWYYGHVEDLEVTRTPATCARYIAKYTCKEYGKEDIIEKISPHDVESIIDPDFILKDFKWKERNLMFYYRVKYLSLKYRGTPSDISFSDLLPRCCHSVNFGMSFIYNLSQDEILDYFLSKSKCTLVGSRKASVISLPYYYYKKICKYSVRYTFGTSYLRNFGVRGPRVVHCLEEYHWKDCFTLVKGFFQQKVPRTYSKSFFSDFGNKVRNMLYDKKLDYFAAAIKSVCLNQHYFSSFFQKDYSRILPGIGLYYVDIKECEHICRRLLKLSTKSLKHLLFGYFHFERLSGIFEDIKYVINLFNYSKSVFAYEQNLIYNRLFKQRLKSTAQRDPDLLIPKFISILSYG